MKTYGLLATPRGLADTDDALEILDNRRDITLVITDTDMPGSMNGLKLASMVATAASRERRSNRD